MSDDLMEQAASVIAKLADRLEARIEEVAALHARIEALARTMPRDRPRRPRTGAGQMSNTLNFVLASPNEAADKIDEMEERVEALETQLADNSERYGNKMADRIEALEKENRELRKRLGEADDDRRSEGQDK